MIERGNESSAMAPKWSLIELQYHLWADGERSNAGGWRPPCPLQRSVLCGGREGDCRKNGEADPIA